MLKLATTLKRSADTEVLQECKTLLQKCMQGFEDQDSLNTEFGLTTMNNLAQVLEKLGRLDEAEAMYRRTLAEREIVLGKHHPDTLITVNNLGLLLESRKGEAEMGSEADLMYRRALPFTPRDM